MVSLPDDKAFVDIVERVPLVSIDLTIFKDNQVLLGLRNDAPAKDWWFVPGGSIKKNEDLPEAFLRITQEELGTAVPINAALFRGPFVHKYPDETFKGRQHVDIHYVVLAYELNLDMPLRSLPRKQHRSYRWATIPAAIADPHVHSNAKLLLGHGTVPVRLVGNPSGDDLLSLYRGYQSSINSYANVVWQFPLALVALNVLAWANLRGVAPAMLVVALLNLILLQPLFKLVANQRSIIEVTRTIEQELRMLYQRPPQAAIIPTFTYPWPLSIKSGTLLPWALFVLDMLLLGGIVAELIRGAA